MLRTTDLEYELTEDRIATHPVEPRDAAKMLVVGRSARGAAEHAHVRDLPRYLRAGDLLVRNTTAVLPARFLGWNEGTGAKAQGLYLSPGPSGEDGRRWQVLLKMRRHREGVRVRLLDRHGQPSDVVLILEGLAKEKAGSGTDDDAAGWIVRVESRDAPTEHDRAILERVGLAPLPPYILASRKREVEASAPGEIKHDLETYQTVYADPARSGSVAAPTAGLHFTSGLLAELSDMGVRTADVVLHVGMGTFKPIDTEYVEQHPMHAEWCTFPAATARAIVETRRAGRHVFAVGTTSARTLESFDDAERITRDKTTATRLLITPGYRFRNLDGLMTNFHLPRSTLLAMVGALLGPDDGIARLLEYYREAMDRSYRFYSFGDAMLITP